MHTLYENNLDGSLIFSHCQVYFPDGYFFTYLYCEKVQRGSGEEELPVLSIYFVQFVFSWQFVLYPPV